jgi:tetratricopeptide (TPR) repeat protein
MLQALMHSFRCLFVGLLVGCAGNAPLPPKAIALNQAGAEAAAQGDLTTAEARLSLATEYNPKFTEAWVNLGLVELRRGNLEQAGKYFRKARDLNEDLPTPHHGLGLVAAQRADSKDAELQFRAALKVDPGFAPARISLARLLFASQKLEEARAEFLRLTQIAPNEVSGFMGLGECLFRLDRKADARALLDAAEQRFPSAPELALLRGRMALAEEQLPSARRAFELATRSRDRFVLASALSHLGLIELTSDRASADRYAKRAREQNAEDPVLQALERELKK